MCLGDATYRIELLYKALPLLLLQKKRNWISFFFPWMLILFRTSHASHVGHSNSGRELRFSLLLSALNLKNWSNQMPSCMYPFCPPAEAEGVTFPVAGDILLYQSSLGFVTPPTLWFSLGCSSTRLAEGTWGMRLCGGPIIKKASNWIRRPLRLSDQSDITYNN